jgi:thiosulfate dehydrogenase
MKAQHLLVLLHALPMLLMLQACGKEDENKSRGMPAPDPAAKPVEVKLCDNHTTTTVAGDAPKTRELGQKIADSLMAKWKEKNPEADWEAEERKSRTFLPAADNSAVLKAGSQAPGTPYRNFTQRDLDEWKRETETLVVAGSKVFHSGEELGSTIAVSCDMCHPNAANTHPETYPKYQTQLGRVALLRDMINWCLEHPVRAPKMDADDPRMRAMEAYIVSQRTGTTLSYGKH